MDELVVDIMNSRQLGNVIAIAKVIPIAIVIAIS